MGDIVKKIPNMITVTRLVGAGCLACTEAFSPEFYLFYSFCGVTDVLDGMLARGLHAQSELGSRLDSVGDFMFYGVGIALMFPFLMKNLPAFIWWGIWLTLGVRVFSYGLAAVRYRCFASLHTWGNKLTGFSIFAFPYMIQCVSAKISGGVVVAVALLASLEELLIHLTSKCYTPGRKSIFQKV